MPRRPPFSTLPLIRRVLFGAAVGGGGLGIFAALLAVITLAGGRYQTGPRGSTTEYDMWLLTAVYPLGAALAGAIGGAVIPYVRRSWQAAAAGTLAMLPFFALISLTADPRGPRPYRVDWPLSTFCAALIGGVGGVGILRGKPRRRRSSRKGRAEAG